MHNVLKVWFVGCLATAATTASTILNAILAVNNTSNDRLAQALRTLLFVGLGFSFLGSLSLFYFTTSYVRNVKNQSLHSVWGVFFVGVVISLTSIILPAITLVWLLIEQQNLQKRIFSSTSIVWVAAWFGCWGVAFLSQFALFVILGFWTKKCSKHQSTSRLDIDFGTRLPPTPQDRIPDEYRSFHSRETTIAEPPRTPSTIRPGSSYRYSSSSKAPASNSRTRLVSAPRSAKSSLDTPFPAGEANSIDSAFDRWDTSAVHSEMRAAVGSSPVARMGLETIPGSRPESPEDVIEEPFLPSSPQIVSSSPQAITSDRATTLGDWSSSPSRQITTSSPPSSPPNFSRPTSRGKNQAMTAGLDTSMQEIIHPLFRASSPHPPPIATSGTMLTASPLANQPITPRTLASLRNHNKSSSALSSQYSRPSGHWRAMPSISYPAERRPSTSGSQGPGSPPPGSPGPSIADEDELPPILPGFVLSAGTRSSMLGYANRKSIKKDRRVSQMSGSIAEV